MTGNRRIWVMAKGYAPDEGGMQTYAEGVAEAWSRTGARVTVFSQTSIGPRVCDNATLRLVDVGPGKSAKVPWLLLKAMRRERRDRGAPAFVHATTWRTALLPMAMRLTYAVTFHGREFMYPRAALLLAMRRAARRARAVVAVSHYSAARLAERIGRRRLITVAWNGLTAASTDEKNDEPGAFWPDGCGARVLSLCRLEPRKNVGAALHACAAAKAAGHSFHMIVAGRGPDEKNLKLLAAELGLEGHVTFAGFVPTADVPRLYREAEIFLHPQITIDEGSDFEGFGIAIADAMAAYCAVIAGAAGGTPELIDAHSGVIVDGTDQSAVTGALLGLLGNPVSREEMGRAAHARASKWFSWDRHVSQIEHAISQSA